MNELVCLATVTIDPDAEGKGLNVELTNGDTLEVTFAATGQTQVLTVSQP